MKNNKKCNARKRNELRGKENKSNTENKKKLKRGGKRNFFKGKV